MERGLGSNWGGFVKSWSVVRSESEISHNTGPPKSVMMKQYRMKMNNFCTEICFFDVGKAIVLSSCLRFLKE
jgi:hypothetical protein